MISIDEPVGAVYRLKGVYITAHGTVTVTNNNMGGSGDRQAYFENRFPGRNVIILPDGGALGIADGNTVIVGGAGDYTAPHIRDKGIEKIRL